MPSNFKFNLGGNAADFDDAFIRRDLFSQGGLWTWGYNSRGLLGDNTVTNKSSPIQTIAGGANWKLVSCNKYHTAAIKTDGTLWNWGFNSRGQLGNNNAVSNSSPVQTIAGGTNWKLVSAGYYYTAAIKTDGTLWLWGSNDYGALGDNTITNKSSPVQTIAAGTNWKLVSCGQYHTAAIKTDGALWFWGKNQYGQLGDNTVTNKSSPVQTVAGGNNWKLVSCGWYHTAAIKTDGTLWLWGSNDYGALGDNSLIKKSSPVQTIAGGANWKQISCGFYHTAAIKTNGTLWSWGNNSSGQLGNNTITNKSSPVQTIAGGTNWKQVAGGGYHTAAIKTDGRLWLWGFGGGGSPLGGQLGDNTTTDKSSPIQTIAGGTNWKQVAGGGYHTAAVKDDY